MYDRLFMKRSHFSNLKIKTIFYYLAARVSIKVFTLFIIQHFTIGKKSLTEFRFVGNKIEFGFKSEK